MAIGAVTLSLCFALTGTVCGASLQTLTLAQAVSLYATLGFLTLLTYVLAVAAAEVAEARTRH